MLLKKRALSTLALLVPVCVCPSFFAVAGMASEEAFLPVPLTRQTTDYSCGASAIQAVLAYYGLEFSESEIIKKVKTDAKFGTSPGDIARFAREQGLEASVHFNLTLDDLQKSLNKKQPAILEVQAWPDDEAKAKSYANVWDEGHFLVLIGMDAHRIYFEDPSLLGSRGFIPKDAFLERWHDVTRSGKHLQHTGVLFNGDPTPPRAWQFIP